MRADEVFSRLENVSPSGDGFTARCPAHEDEANSLSVRETEDRILVHCFAGCPPHEVVKAMGLRMRHLFKTTSSPRAATRPVEATASTRTEPSATAAPTASLAHRPAGITVRALAAHKRLPIELLDRLGVHDLRLGGVGIPYHDENGEVARVRRRSALVAKEGSSWLKGPEPPPYLLPLLPLARKAGYLVLVEGETDAWTLVHHHFPVLGLPGAQHARKLAAPHLEGVARLFVVREPDRGGEIFTQGIFRRLAELEWKGEAREVRLEGAKDPSELHLRDPDTFRDAFERALAAAAPLAAPSADSPAPERSGATQSTRLVALAECADYFHTPDREAYASFVVHGHRETWPVRSRTFKHWLTRLFYEAEGEAASSNVLSEATNLLEARAVLDGPEAQVFTRVAAVGDGVLLDLCDPRWRVVQVSREGWAILERSPVYFRRASGMLPLPEPVPGGSLSELRAFVNVGGDADWLLLVSWLLGALRGRGPFPALALHGEQGSAKSVTARVMRALVDPSTAPLRAEPQDVRDLVIAATNSWVVALDNLSHIPDWLSDALCRLATGGGFSTRELYSNRDECLFEVQRPTILTGIPEPTGKDDLADRALLIELPTIPPGRRLLEARLWEGFEAARGKILGAALDVVVRGLVHAASTAVPENLRMADFAHFVAAAVPALGIPGQTFIDAYTANRRDGSALALEASSVASAVRRVAAMGRWTGKACDLLDLISGMVDEAVRRHRSWPRNPRALAAQLRQRAPSLRACGVDVTFSRDAGPRRDRLITIEAVPTVAPVGATARSTAPEAAPRVVAETPSHGATAPEAALVGAVVTPPTAPVTYQLVGTRAAFDHLMQRLLRADAVAVDTETRPRRDDLPADGRTRRYWALTASLNQLVGISFSFSLDGAPLEHHYLPLRHTSEPHLALDDVRGDLQRFFEAPIIRRIFHNAKFDINVLRQDGLEVVGLPDDTLLLASLIDLHALPRVDGATPAEVRHEQYVRERPPLGLKELARRYITPDATGHETAVATSRAERARELGVKRDDVTYDEVPLALLTPYAATDARWTHELADILLPRLDDAPRRALYQTERELVRVLGAMEHEGALVDREFLENAAVEYAVRIEATRRAVHAAAGRSDFDLDSNPQLIRVFEAAGVPVPTGSSGRPALTKEALAALAPVHPLARAVAEYRRVAKVKGTYIDSLLGKLDERARVHCTFNAHGARTGRLSSDGPNLQNIPAAMRAAFVPPEGHVLVCIDMSQVELRIVAHYSADPVLVDAFGSGQDVHRRTAVEVFGDTAEAAEMKRRRKIAKNLNFAICYGAGASRLAAMSGESVAACKEHLARFDRVYARLAAWKREVLAAAHREGRVTNLYGRMRWLPILTDASMRGEPAYWRAERCAVNTLIQGTAADMFKETMVRMASLLHDRRARTRMVLNVHDELVFYVPHDELDLVPELRHVMEQPSIADTFRVPLVADVSWSATSWRDKVDGLPAASASAATRTGPRATLPSPLIEAEAERSMTKRPRTSSVPREAGHQDRRAPDRLHRSAGTTCPTQSRWDPEVPADHPLRARPRRTMMIDQKTDTLLDESLWDARDVARYFRASRSWVYHQAEAGLLPHLRVGGLLRFDPRAVRAFAEGQQRAPRLISGRG